MENVNESDSLAQTGEIKADAKKLRRPKTWLAGVLALVMPGLGHLYLGLPVLAIVFWVAAVVLANLAWAVIIFANWGWPGIALVVLVSLCFVAWQIVDVVKRSRGMERRLFVVPWYMLAVIFVLWLWGGKAVLPVFGSYETYKATTSAMENTLMMGDRFTVDLGAYRSSDVQRGDIIAFFFPLDHEYKYIKRCIGLPGDTIFIFDKTLYVNGQEVEGPPTICYIDTAIMPRKQNGQSSRDNFGPYVVNEGGYFVLGDNRDNTTDSRFWGCVPKEDVIGKVISISWSGELRRIGRGVE